MPLIVTEYSRKKTQQNLIEISDYSRKFHTVCMCAYVLYILEASRLKILQ